MKISLEKTTLNLELSDEKKVHSEIRGSNFFRKGITDVRIECRKPFVLFQAEKENHVTEAEWAEGREVEKWQRGWHGQISLEGYRGSDSGLAF